jgi:TetR/AcrR family transcriptional regulator, transcriptional repressor for nem operon
MRQSKTEKANTHKRIVTIAAKKFREEGISGIGIADLMKKAGLTAGGFYKHFKSRDALVAEAIGSAMELWKDRIDAAAARGPRFACESLIDEYLSVAHRDDPGMGCPVSALAGDLARSDKRTRAVATRKIADNIELLSSLIRDAGKTGKDTARSRAIVTYCAMVGAVSMARAISDQELSREILKTVARRLKSPAL